MRLCKDSKVVHTGGVHWGIVCCCMWCSLVVLVLQHLVFTGAWCSTASGAHWGRGGVYRGGCTLGLGAQLRGCMLGVVCIGLGGLGGAYWGWCILCGVVFIGLGALLELPTRTSPVPNAHHLVRAPLRPPMCTTCFVHNFGSQYAPPWFVHNFASQYTPPWFPMCTTSFPNVPHFASQCTPQRA